MNRVEFRKLLQRWCMEDSDGQKGIEELKRDIEFLERKLYHEYSVTAYGGHGSFGSRLARWIGNVESDVDRQNLYRLLAHLFFIGKSEQEAAYRTAFSKHILQWLMVVSGIDPFQADAHQRINQELQATRFTEITDSFGIREFCLLNSIQGEQVRYKWEGNTNNWNSNEFRRDVLRENCQGEVPRRNIVLLEDFVGSGSQMAKAVKLACSLGQDVNLLLCPLFICPVGARYAGWLSRTYDNLTFSPVLALERQFFIRPKQVTGEHINFNMIRTLLEKIHPEISGAQQEFGPFGYCDTGSFVVPASNCPDNTIPALHRRNENLWEPLFLRTSRLPL
uniref:phosphoribosyltransferase-like protein n=1 Tax=Pararhizobium sp. IMCC3301 TaxID=3067904 RepID=UPI0027415242|nr:hypothetical protein [Pararhizobium sp. IMCC3301]